MMITDTSTYLGSARVAAAGPGSDWLEVALPSGERARARVAMPYRAAEGDEVLVLRQEPDRMFAIGLLHSSKPACLRVPGDLAIEAGGTLTLSSGGGLQLASEDHVEATAPRVALRTGRLELLAQRFVQRVQSAYIWVTDLFQLKSRRVRTVAEGAYLVKAGRTHVKSTQDVTIDGRTIHLG